MAKVCPKSSSCFLNPRLDAMSINPAKPKVELMVNLNISDTPSLILP